MFAFQNQLNTRQYSNNWLKALLLAARITLTEYLERTKVCGMWLLRSKEIPVPYRCLWAILLLNLFLLACYISLQLWLKFYSYPILNTISNDLPIAEVPFPGVTICSPKPFKKEHIESYLKKLYIPSEYNVSFVADSFEYINAFTFQNWKPSKQVDLGLADEVLHFNNITLYQAFLNISSSCDDFIKKCFWGSKEFPCHEKHEHLSFIPTISHWGPCCSFNYNPWNISYRPLPSEKFGLEGGLSFVGFENSDANDISTGLIVLIHHSNDFTTETAASVVITPKLESFIEVSAIIHSSSEDVLELAPNKRECLTPADLDLNTYRQAACILECKSKILSESCDCRPYHFPADKHLWHKECKFKDIYCYKQYYDKLNRPQCEHCLPSCHDTTYSIFAYNTDLRQHSYALSSLYSHNNPGDNAFIVRVFLPKQVVPAIHKVIVMSWITLLSDLGGVFNLCVGLSIISLIEFFYYLFYRLYYNFQQHRKTCGVKIGFYLTKKY